MNPKMSTGRSKPEETILGGFNSDSNSESDSDLSETWSELGEQIFSIPDDDPDDPDQPGQDPLEELDSIPDDYQINDEYDPPADQLDDYDDGSNDYLDEKPVLDFKIEDNCDPSSDPAFFNELNFNMISISDAQTVELKPQVNFMKQKQRRPRRVALKPKKKLRQSIVCEICHKRFRFVQDYAIHNNPQARRGKYSCEPRTMSIPSATTSIISQEKKGPTKVYIKKPKIEVVVIHEKNLRPRSRIQKPPDPFEEKIEAPHFCEICHKRYFQDKFLKMHQQDHYASLNLQGLKLKCINSDCSVTSSTNYTLRKHVNICELSLKTRKENEERHQINPFDCVFVKCSEGFENMTDFFDHVESIHGLICNRGIAVKNVRKHVKFETSEKRAQRLAKKKEYMRKRRHLLNYEASTTNCVTNAAEEKKEKRLAKKRENRRRLKNETDEQRTRRLNCLKEAQRRRLAIETDEERSQRLNRQKEYKRRRLAIETDEERSQRLAKMRENSRQRYFANDEPNDNDESTFEDQNIFNCDKCHIEFSRKGDLSSHNRNFHPESYFENRRYICETCGKSFQYSYYLDMHSKTHGEKIHKCPHENCSKSYAIAYNLTVHIRSHNRTSNTTTATTSSSTKTKRQLSEKNHLCELCGVGYSRRIDYLGHKKEHLRLLTLRKEAYEKKIRSENPIKSDQEILEILVKFWESNESHDLRTAPETTDEKKARCRLKHIEEIIKKGLKLWNESIDECLDRLKKTRLEKIQRKRETETEEERLERRKKYLILTKNYVDNNREKYLKHNREYQKKKFAKKKKENNPEVKAKELAYARDRYAKMTQEKRARRLEYLKNYQKQKKEN